MEYGKIGTYRLVAEPFHVDFSGSLFLGVLGNHLLNCAGFHAKERGFGMASLNERAKVDYIISEGLINFHLYKDEKEREEKVQRVLHEVGLLPEFASRFPHEFSGGQRQRIGIARALIMEPEFIVADEPISALDVSIRAQVLNLLNRLKKSRGLTYLFIAHDLSMVKHISERVGVMYLGSLVEITSSGELYSHPLHPYTQALLSAIPIPDPEIEAQRETARIRLEGEVPSPIDPPPGCKFAGRCKYATERCRQEMPPLEQLEGGRCIRCWNYKEIRYDKQ